MSNAATLRRLFELMDQQRPDAIGDLLSTDFTAVIAGNPPLDREAWKGMGAMFYAAFPDGAHTIDEAHDIGSDRAVLVGSFEGTHQQPFMGIPPTGKRVRISFMNLDRFTDGRIAEHRVQIDMLGLMQQLGALPAS